MPSNRFYSPASSFAECGRCRDEESQALLKNTQCNKTPQSGWPIQPTLSPSGYRDALDGGRADLFPSESPLPHWLMSSIHSVFRTEGRKDSNLS